MESEALLWQIVVLTLGRMLYMKLSFVWMTLRKTEHALAMSSTAGRVFSSSIE